MPEDTTPESSETPGETPPEESQPAKKAAAKKAPAKKAAAKKAPAKKTAAKKAPAKKTAAAESAPAEEAGTTPSGDAAPRKTTARKRTARTADTPAPETTDAATGDAGGAGGEEAAGGQGTVPLFQPPDPAKAPARKPRKKAAAAPAEADTATPEAAATSGEDGAATGDRPQDETSGDDESGEGGARRRRRRGGRRRRKPGSGNESGDAAGDSESDSAAEEKPAGSGEKQNQQQKQNQKQKKQDGDDQADGDEKDGGESSSSRRRRRRRRSGDDGGDSGDDPQNTVTKVRQGRTGDDQITAVTGSTRLEAKKQRRREGREAGRRRAPIVSEAEFLARRESVDRVMAIRQRDDLTQIAVLEDKVLVEHYVARESQTSLIGNVYLGRVQNVLPSMEAAFVDIGKGRNAVLYAGEVNWQALGHQDGQPRKIESVLSSGQSILVQVTKDPVGHKGARLTSQVSLAGRFLVYVPDGTNSGISRKLPDTERSRLKSLLKEIVPDGAGVIVRTAAEGASEDELTRDVERLTARWSDIEKKSKGNAPQLLYGEPDLMLKVVRDLFTEDFSKLVVQGEDAWSTVHDYVVHVAPDLEERLEKYDSEVDLFAAYRIDEQIAKGLDRKVWLPSGGSLIIDRTEAMTVVDVNTGKFTGSGGNLEETVTKNNLEAAEELVRQLRLRDIGGIIVVDFIDMVLESNRDLVLRRLVECLGRDRTRHQVAEVTSLGLVQMTRKRIGTGLLEAFSETCGHCNGRGLTLTEAPVEPKKGDDDSRRGGGRRSRRGRSEGSSSGGNGASKGASTPPPPPAPPSPKDVAAMARAAQASEPVESPPEQVESPPEQVESPAEQVESPAVPVESPPEQVESPAEQAESSPVPDETAETPEAPAAAEQPAEPEAPAGPAPGTTTVVTRTRRRSASRPAGPPPGSESANAVVPAAASGVVGSPPADGAVEPGTVDAEPAAPPVVEHVPVKKRGSRKR